MDKNEIEKRLFNITHLDNEQICIIGLAKWTSWMEDIAASLQTSVGRVEGTIATYALDGNDVALQLVSRRLYWSDAELLRGYMAKQEEHYRRIYGGTLYIDEQSNKIRAMLMLDRAYEANILLQELEELKEARCDVDLRLKRATEVVLSAIAEIVNKKEEKK